MHTPVEWVVAARMLWPVQRGVQELRRNFDAVVASLQRRLREGGVREDRGNIEAFFTPTVS